MPVEIRFEPGLVPVLKHGEHNQKTHAGKSGDLSTFADEIDASLTDVLSAKAEESRESWVYNNKWPKDYLDEASSDSNYQSLLHENMRRMGWRETVTVVRRGTPQADKFANGSLDPDWQGRGYGQDASLRKYEVPLTSIIGVGHANEAEVFFSLDSAVLKHGSHNQQSHAGRRASSTADLLERYTSDHRAMVEAGLKPSKLVARLGGAVGDFQRRTENLLERRGLKRRRGPKTYTREEAEALRRQYAEKYGPRTRMTFRGGSDLRPASLRDQAGDWRD